MDLERVSSPSDTMSRSDLTYLCTDLTYFPMVTAQWNLYAASSHQYLVIFLYSYWKWIFFLLSLFEEKNVCNRCKFLYRLLNTFRVITVQWNLVNRFISAIDCIALGFIMKFQIVFEKRALFCFSKL